MRAEHRFPFHKVVTRSLHSHGYPQHAPSCSVGPRMETGTSCASIGGLGPQDDYKRCVVSLSLGCKWTTFFLRPATSHDGQRCPLCYTLGLRCHEMAAPLVRALPPTAALQTIASSLTAVPQTVVSPLATALGPVRTLS